MRWVMEGHHRHRVFFSLGVTPSWVASAGGGPDFRARTQTLGQAGGGMDGGKEEKVY